MRLVKVLLGVLLLVVVLVVAAVLLLPKWNTYDKDGRLVLAGLHHPVKVLRDAKAMAYIYAEDLHDAIMAQGFVTAQDRLFQMQLARMAAAGRLSELVGEKARGLDLRRRAIGLYRIARRHLPRLNRANQDLLQSYADGVNAYLRTRGDELPLSFTLAGIKPEPWTKLDSLAIYYYLSWAFSANLKTEVLAQMLVEKLGPRKAAEIFPLNLNPDDPADHGAAHPAPAGAARLGLSRDRLITAWTRDLGPRWGSNAWAMAASASGKPIVANDPHLDPRILPGMLYPCAIITKQTRGVGITVAGLPGLVSGRNQYIALGITNSYCDVQDLYVETIDPKDPNRYLEGGRSVPFEIITETMKIKDRHAAGGYRTEQVKIRLTHRGPVVSGLLPGLKTNKVLTLRWAPAESGGASLGIIELMRSRSAAEVMAALRLVSILPFNAVFADVQGNVGFFATGRVPRRIAGDGTVPLVVTSGQDNWQGWIPLDQMPQAFNPSRGWVGSCNHKTVPHDYPYYYSSYFAPTYRYSRLRELLDSPGVKSAADHWRFQRDRLNPLARKIVPIMAKALAGDPATKPLARILAAWDFQDAADTAAPLVFQAVMRRFALEVYRDELGEDLARRMLAVWYFWQQRLERMILDGDSPWFDDVTTPGRREGMAEMWVRAGKHALAELSERLGDDPAAWVWGRVHRLVLVHPLRRKGPGAAWLGGGTHAMGGSGETLYRAWYDFNRSFDVTVAAALRMVVDLGDPEKVLAVLPGGVTGRLFDPHMTDQVEPYMKGTKLYWWFSDRAIAAHAKHTQVLAPR